MARTGYRLEALDLLRALPVGLSGRALATTWGNHVFSGATLVDGASASLPRTEAVTRHCQGLAG
jgi:hypothetical protein